LIIENILNIFILTENLTQVLKTEISVLKAYQGDCILIKTFDAKDNPFVILIDGGTSQTFEFSLRKELQSVKVIDLLVLTHIDSDHIGGIINFIRNSIFENITVNRYWINCKNLIEAGPKSDKISYGQAKDLEELLIERKEDPKKFSEKITSEINCELSSGIHIDILSPTAEVIENLNKNWLKLNSEYQKKLQKLSISSNVRSQLLKGSLQSLAIASFHPQKTVEADVFNAASIAFILRSPDVSLLTLADSRAEIVVEKLISMGYNSSDNKLIVDYVKVSHHGSKNNTSNELLDLIDSSNFIISTNGGSLSTKHPDRETIARILYHPKRDPNKMINIFFNYALSDIERKCGKIFTDEELVQANVQVFDNILKLPINAPENP
jgi:beta-lactamase superfamily II metal-dependent hydrolase